MKAIVYTRYGSPGVLHLQEVAKPAPKDNEICVRIKSTAVNSGDVRLRKADPFAVRLFFGLRKPRINILGSVFAGEVESVGAKVNLFKPGDRIFGHTNMRFGAYAEYICIDENASLACMPQNMNYIEAAALPFGGVTALHFVKKANIKPEQKVLIIGASGAVGSAVVQLAKFFGATVTGVCSTANTELVKSIGADHVIDYKKEDFTNKNERYDLIFDCVNAVPVFQSSKCLHKNGKLILSAAGMAEMLQGSIISIFSRRKVITGVTGHKAEDLLFLKKLAEEGKYKAVIDRTYALHQIPEAHSYVQKGHKKGNVVIEVN